MRKILLIKTGAAGDIVRTTVLLRALHGKITWVTGQEYQDILPRDYPKLEKILTPTHASTELRNQYFDLIISLEEDEYCARLASETASEKIIGIYYKHGRITYTPDSAGWFDMSLVSHKGRDFANEAKWNNKTSFQEHLFKMAGLQFLGESYCIYRNKQISPGKPLIGIETRVGTRWPNKAWGGYQELMSKLHNAGYECLLLQERKNIGDYLDDIARCTYVVCGDTLAMHVALAYEIPVLAIFNCTSPSEIYDYGLLRKLVSPLLHQSFYSLEYAEAVVNSITPETAYTVFEEHILATKYLQKA